jgi:hypothetical protein
MHRSSSGMPTAISRAIGNTTCSSQPRYWRARPSVTDGRHLLPHWIDPFGREAYNLKGYLSPDFARRIAGTALGGVQG